MGLKKYRPLTPTLRYKLSSDFKEITASEPEKSLIVKTNYSSGGRNNSGKMTMRYIGGGHKKSIKSNRLQT
jgi:large subunit ribosomal protein L2